MQVNSRIPVLMGLTSVLLALVLVSPLANSKELLPEKLQCVSEIFMLENGKESEGSWKIVEEYVDRENSRSSISLTDKRDDTTHIYFNEIPPSDSSYSRKMIEYNVRANKCSSTKIIEWPLAMLRRTLIAMMPLNHLSKSLCDIAIGPSALLYGIQLTLDKYSFVNSQFSQSRIVQVDVYERILDDEFHMVSGMKSLIITVQTPTPPRKSKKEEPKTLEEAVEKDGKFNVLTVTICSAFVEKIRNRDQKKPYDCNIDEVMMQIEYYVVTEMVAGNLIGQTLDRSSDFDFHRDPFMQPVGIGCWEKEYDDEVQKRFFAPSSQFSGEYYSTRGTNDLAYVAYDGPRKTLRLDRAAHKSVYDLEAQISYHVAEFYSAKGTDKLDNRAHSCIAISNTDDSIRSPIMVERLIGVGLKSDQAAYYLGSKMIDHVSYEVYELELNFGDLGLEGYNLPIVLEPAMFTMPTVKKDRHFVTYYNIEHQNPTGQDDQKSRPISIPKYMELWSWHQETKYRKLLNRLEFTAFAWALDVEPSGDPDTTDLSNLFVIDSCIQDRSQQVQLKFRVNQETNGPIKDDLAIAALQNSRPMIKEKLAERLASTMQVPRMMVAQVDVDFSPAEPTSILVDAKLVELQTGITRDKFLGFIKFFALLDDMGQSSLAIYRNRHSIDACRLDSLANSHKNTMIFCGSLTYCLLYKDEEVQKFKDKIKNTPEEARKASQYGLPDFCSVHQFNWAPRPFDEREGLQYRVQQARNKLQGDRVRIPVLVPSEPTEVIVYQGYAFELSISFLDTSGFAGSPGTSQSPLSGLRMQTGDEKPGTLNMNLAVDTGGRKGDSAFSFCQQACQLDPYCESFSACGRRKSPSQPYDCVLSTMRLTFDRILQLSKELEKVKNSDESFEIKVSGEFMSQGLTFKKDPQCNVHPKDLLSFYKLVRTFRIDPKPGALIPTKADSQEGGSVGTVGLSLEDCAAYGRELSIMSAYSDFVYCPLRSICLHNTADKSKLPIGSLCYEYAPSFSQFYQETSGGRFMIKLDRIKEATKEQLEAKGVGRWIEGLNQEQCARDCNLEESNCLAYDICNLDGGKSTCILYSISSPIPKRPPGLDFLKLEKEFYTQMPGESTPGSAFLVGARECKHMSLKGDYYEIRLRQMLAGHAKQEQRDRLNKEEQKQLDEDQKKGEAELAELRDELKGAKDRLNGPQSISSGGLSLIMILIGAVMGLLCALYASTGAVYLADTWELLKVRASERHAGHRLSQLGLANNLSL